jgi:hypothetical protein
VVRKNVEKGVEVCYGHSVFQQPRGEKNFEDKILLSQNFKKLKTSQQHCNQTYITNHRNNSTGSSMPEHSVSEAKEMRKKADCY